jgi:glyoxylase-like metal-dependent hydrolase (beta-lactamase superfamily II)
MSAPASHSRKLGDFELTIVSDGVYVADGGAMFGVVPKPLWEKKVRADDKNRIPCGTNSVLVRAFGRLVLIETGIGNKLPEKMAQIFDAKAELLRNLEALGVRRQEIEVVINSHLHFDHCGWNTFRNERGEIEPTFPNATYYAQRGEWEHASRQLERDSVSYFSDNYDPLIKNGQMRLFDGDGDVMPGISVVIYPGHTRNMQAILLESEDEKACYISDLIPTTWHLDLTWVMSYDLFPLETIQNRKRFYQQAIPEKWLTIFTHDPETPWAYLEWDQRGKVIARRETGR